MKLSEMEKAERADFRARVNRYKKHFNLLPDDLVLYVAGQDFNGDDSNICLLGWTLRGHLAALTEQDPEDVEERHARLDGDYGYKEDPNEYMARVFGGDKEVWQDIYIGVTATYEDDGDGDSYPTGDIEDPAVEVAWVDRVVTAVQRA